MLLRNPKTGEELTTTLTEEEAAKICGVIQQDFPQSLVRQLRQKGCLSPVQYFWLFKIAEDKNPKKQEVIVLLSDLQSFISVVPTMQFKLLLDNGTEFGKILLRTSPSYISVFGAYKMCGKIVADKFYPTSKCWQNLKVQILLFSGAPQRWMEQYGKATGQCCVCGRELTNEESVSRGIGPICAERFGF